MTSQITTYQGSHGEISLSVSEIKQLFCPKASDVEARMFLEVCRYQGLNPFLKEAYLIKYQEGEPASIVVGKEVFTKRALRIDDCVSWRAGVLVNREGQLVEQEGSFLLPGDELLGGWCRITRKSSDIDYCHMVDIKEYIQTTREGNPTRFWAKMPATMIRKVALVQGLRECFPEDYQGLYDSAEITGGLVVESVGRMIPDARPLESESESELPDFGKCPIHPEVKWITKKDKFGSGLNVFHFMPEGSDEKYCRLSIVLKTQMGDLWAKSHDGTKVQSEINLWLKTTYNGATWSKMSPSEWYAAVRLMAGQSGVDTTTGEIDGSDDTGQDQIDNEHEEWLKQQAA